MTVREKIIELMQFRHVNGWSKIEEYPPIDIYVDLKHDLAFGSTSLNILIHNGIPNVTHLNIPKIYDDIFDQEVISETKEETYESSFIIHLHLSDEYLDQKAKYLLDNVGDPEEVKESIRNQMLEKTHSCDIYKQADEKEKAYIDAYMNDVIERFIASTKDPLDMMKTGNILLTHVGDVLVKKHQAYLNLGKTNYDLIMKKDIEKFADFLFLEAPIILSEHRTLESIFAYLSETEEA